MGLVWFGFLSNQVKAFFKKEKPGVKRQFRLMNRVMSEKLRL